jgi:hypothetical protein
MSLIRVLILLAAGLLPARTADQELIQLPTANVAYSATPQKWAANTTRRSPTLAIAPGSPTSNRSAGDKRKRRETTCSTVIEGATCYLGTCDSSRNASCQGAVTSASACVCGDGSCAVGGACLGSTAPSTAPSTATPTTSRQCYDKLADSSTTPLSCVSNTGTTCLNDNGCSSIPGSACNLFQCVCIDSTGFLGMFPVAGGCFVNNKCVRKWRDGNNQTCDERYGRSVTLLDTVVGPAATFTVDRILRVAQSGKKTGQSRNETDALLVLAISTVLQSTTDSAQPRPTTDSAVVQHPLLGSLIRQHWRD